MSDEGDEIEVEGALWMGSRQELEAWKQYKKDKAIRFVERGFSVSWYPDGTGYIEIFVPERYYAKKPELRASAVFFRNPSQYGIDRGRVSKLMIQYRRSDVMARALRRPSDLVETLYNYDRGLDFDHLDDHPDARKLYEVIIEEIN